MLAPVQQSILQFQGSFLREGINYNTLGRFGVGAMINSLCYHPISSTIDRLENRLKVIEEDKKFLRKVVAFSSLTFLLNLVQVKILLGSKLSKLASAAVIVTWTALMTLKYIYDKTKGYSSPLSKLNGTSVNPSLPNSNYGRGSNVVSPPRFQQEGQNPNNLSLPTSTAPQQPSPREQNRPVTASSSNPPLLNILNWSQGRPLELSLMPTFQKPISENILSEEQYHRLENALHCRRETLNYLFTGLEADRDRARKGFVFEQLRHQISDITTLLSRKDFLPEEQNREGPYLDENMRKLFDHYIEEFMRPMENRDLLKKFFERYKFVITSIIERSLDAHYDSLMRRLFSNNDEQFYAACHHADNCAYTSDELKEFVRYFISNPTIDQAFAILTPLHHAGRIIQKHQDEPERLGGKTPSDPGLKHRVMNFFKSQFKIKFCQRPRESKITILEFKMIFSDIVAEYKLLQGKSYRFISMIQP